MLRWLMQAAGADSYVSLRAQWDGYITTLAPALAYNMDDIDPAGSRPESAVERPAEPMPPAAADEASTEQEAIRADGGQMSEAEIDYNVMGTFPASDPPSWTLGVDTRHEPPCKREKPSAHAPSHQNEDIPSA